MFNSAILYSVECVFFMATKVSLMFTKARHFTLPELVESGPHLDNLYSQNITSKLLNAL